jgi:Fungal specific transcription factor domain
MFWFTYILDKSLSLRLGHSSILQDFDITLTLSDHSADSQISMWDTLHHVWIKIGYFEGRIYEELYSPRALSGPTNERAQRAKQLTSDMRQWYQETQVKLDPSRAYNPLYYEAAASSSEIMYYGLSTLAYRAVPPGPLDSSPIFSNECIETARAALRAHQQNSERYKDTNSHIWHGYISWYASLFCLFPPLYQRHALTQNSRVLINCPFTPFMVLFCHAIASANLDDLKCLGDFVSSLQSSGETVEAAEKLWRLCHVFHRVAELYIEAKITQQHHYQHQHHSHLDNHSHHLNDIHQHPSISSASTSTPNIPNTTDDNTSNNAFKYNAPFPIDNFEPYLSALGFPNAAGFLNLGQQQQQQQAGLAPPTPAMATSSAAGVGSGGPATEYNPGPTNLEAGLGSGDANSLENWFTGNVNIMSLLEMDLSSIIK